MTEKTWKNLDTESKVVMFVFAVMFFLYSYGLIRTDSSTSVAPINKEIKKQSYMNTEYKKLNTFVLNKVFTKTR